MQLCGYHATRLPWNCCGLAPDCTCRACCCGLATESPATVAKLMLLVTALVLLLPQEPAATATPKSPLKFTRQELSSQFLCEGAAFGDLDGDGDADVAAGPWWYEGPAFTSKHVLYESKQFHRLHYSDNFFAWIRDMDGDGKNDVFCVGFPGKEAFWLRNTGDPEVWTRHVVFDSVDNESPEFVDITGDGKPELVCQNNDRLGWAEADWSDASKPWVFHAALPAGAGPRFTHGLGVGDLNGDGRPDILRKEGWYEQPSSLQGDPAWPFHAVSFSPSYGGAQMLVTDVDGDGDADVVTAYSAHGWGLAWYEQQDGAAFVPHEVLPAQRDAGNVSELHALCLCDLDGDGLLDVVTGKRWWSHGPSKDGNQDGGNDPAWLLGLLLRRDALGAHYEVTLLDGDSGVGTQVAAGDVDGDGRADVVMANKHGTYVLRQDAPGKQPNPVKQPNPAQERGQPETPASGPDLDFESGTLRGWTAVGEAFHGQPVRHDLVAMRRNDSRSDHHGEYWIGGYEVYEDRPQGTLESDAFVVAKPWASFLVGGGSSSLTRVELLAADGHVLHTASGNNRERMERVSVDLTAHVGEWIRIRLVDESSDGWGHLNFDHFQFHDQQVAGQLPTIATGLSPAAAAKAMTTVDGFQVDLIAGEPDLHQPVALWIDQRNRLWVAEAYSYPRRRKDDEAKDSLIVFEDKDHDGSFESRTVFYDKLNLVSGFAVGFGGVYVGAAPELLFIPDQNGDLIPDGPPEVVLDGFGYEDTHETLNSFVFGPDGWLYGTHGVFTHSLVGAPGTPAKDRVPLNCGVWRFQPQRREFEVFAWGTSNPWGVDFDDRGEAFLACCVISHLWHMVQGGRFERQGGTHFDEHAWIEIATIADHQHFAGNIRDHAWWGRDKPVADVGTDLAGGGHAHCGTLIYKGDAFPAEYRNAMLFHNIHGNRVNQDRLQRVGSGYVGHHAADLVKANDPWFRGVALRTGAAGDVFFIDWYDRNACHRHNPELWDRSNGRLYRLSYGDPVAANVALDQQSDDELAALQASSNDFLAGHARRLLQERGTIAASAKQSLLTMLESHPEPLARLRALWALHAVDGLAASTLLATLQSSEEDLRVWAVRLALEQPARFPEVIAALPGMARSEKSPAVRLALASSLQRHPLAARWELAGALLAFAEDGDDHNIPTLLWYGVEPMAAAGPDRFVTLAQAARVEPVRKLMWRRAAIGEESLRSALVRALSAQNARQAEILIEMVEAVKAQPGMDAPQGWTSISSSLMGNPDRAVRECAADVALAFGDGNLAPVFRARLANPDETEERRLAALEGLVRLRDEATGPMLLELLAAPSMRRAALNAIGAYDLPDAASRILAVMPSLDATDRELALSALGARPSSARVLLESIIAGTTSDRLLDAASLRRQLTALDNRDVDSLLQRAWGRSVRPSASAAVEIARYKQLLVPEEIAQANKSNGRAIFSRTCQACHKLYGEGGVLAPELTGSDRKNLDYLLANIIDPSAEMGREYQLVTVRLADGRQLSGNMVRESEKQITLKSLAGTMVVSRRDLAKSTPEQPAIQYSEYSLMPPNQLQSLSDKDARDLIAYLMDDKQAPIEASAINVGTFFDGASLAGWDANPEHWRVVDGEMIGHTDKGLARNDFARSQLVFSDFRLQVDVKLSPDTGNSGIQFRSASVHDGEMRGYQADIGAGWWGLLYEENGRAILQKAKAEAAKPGEWNSYEILAVGGRVQLAINGVQTVDFTDPAGAREGLIALQLHSGGPTEVRFKNFLIELNPKGELKSLR